MSIVDARKKLPPLRRQRRARPPWHRGDAGGDQRLAEEAFEIAEAAPAEPGRHWRHLRQLAAQIGGIGGDVVRLAALQPAKPAHRGAEVLAAAQREIGPDVDPFDHVSAGRDPGS